MAEVCHAVTGQIHLGKKNTSHRAAEDTEFKRKLFGFVEFVVFIEVNNGNT